jgi:hypothetical protein
MKTECSEMLVLNYQGMFVLTSRPEYEFLLLAVPEWPYVGLQMEVLVLVNFCTTYQIIQFGMTLSVVSDGLLAADC